MTEYEYSRKALRISSSTSMSMMRSSTGSCGGGVRVLLRGIRALAPRVRPGRIRAVPILAYASSGFGSDPPDVVWRSAHKSARADLSVADVRNVRRQGITCGEVGPGPADGPGG